MAEIPTCPDCKSKMVQRVQQKTNIPFWGCSRYPACKSTMSIPNSSDKPKQTQSKETTRVGIPNSSTESKRIPSKKVTRVEHVHSQEPNQFKMKNVVIVAASVLGVLAVLIPILSSSRDKPSPSSKETLVAAAPAPAVIVVNTPSYQPPLAPVAQQEPVKPAVTGASASAAQLSLLNVLRGRKKWSNADRDSQIETVLGYKKSWEELSKTEASKLIDAWDDRKK